MTKRIFFLCSIILITAIFMGCSLFNDDEYSKKEESKLSSNEVDEQVEEILNKMTLTEKIGQMVMIGFNGTDVNEDILYMLRQFHMGGIILFDRNMESIEQVKKLTHDLQTKSDEKLPLFIAVDEEGGNIVRMKHVLKPPPSQEEIGNSGNVDEAKKWAIKISKNLKDMGINTNLAPVADVGSSDGRSYNKDANIVTNFVRSATQGYLQENEIFCVKHFPGIGKGIVDSHYDISNIDLSIDELSKDDLVPFQTIINENTPEDYFILVSHLKYPQIDSTYPASLSPVIIQKLLRDKMEYEGIIITDDLEMGAVSQYYDFKTLGIKAIQAGVDIVLICHEYSHEEEVYMGILNAVKSGEIKEERINDSVRRILKTKLKHL